MNRIEGRGHRLSATASAVVAVLALSVASCNLYFGSENPNVTEPNDQHDGTCSALNDNGGFDDFRPPGIPIELGPTTTLAAPPPPISGGTLTIAPDQITVVGTDPDRDQVYIVSLETMSLIATIPLTDGDEPGRVVVDDDSSHAYVSLRSGGAIAVIDLATNALLVRHAACPAPRGLALDPVSNDLLVACHGGEFITMEPATGQIRTEQNLEQGLRDVAIDGDDIYVTRFREAEALVLDRQGTVTERMGPPALDTFTFDPNTGEDLQVRFNPAIAYRTVTHPDGGVVMVHQRAREGEVRIERGGYGGDPCSLGVVHAAVTPIKSGDATKVTRALNNMVLPADVALTNGGNTAVVVAAGNGMTEFSFTSSVMRVSVGQIHEPNDCFFGEEPDGFQLNGAQPTSVAATQSDTIVIQTREPAQLHVFAAGSTWDSTVIELSSESKFDTGHAIFNMDTGAGIGCVSCHAEGNDDGQVWEFSCIGKRRTQSLQFGIKGTEPFHWDGDMTTIDKLMNEVFVGRMSGGELSSNQITAVADWIDTLRPPPRSLPRDPAAVERGRAIFNDATVGCATCHGGAKFTNNESHDVGTGGKFQVPSLIGVADRAPFIHTGCAPTLKARFTDPACGGDDRHGVVSGLTEQQIDDMVSYLETL